MVARRRFNTESGMATRWRRRRMCVLVCERPFPASLRDVSANGAFLETNARPDIGGRVELLHPDAGQIAAAVRAHGLDGIELSFDGSAPAAAFALRSEEHKSELQPLMRLSYADFCLKKK